MLEIRVEVPDASAASDLSSHLNEQNGDHGATVESDSAHSVVLQANGDASAVLSLISNWIASRSLDNVAIQLNGIRYTVL